MNEQALMKALAILAEAQMRLEHKVDTILNQLGIPTPIVPLSFLGQMCPVCKQMVQYQVDIEAQVVKRTCGCKTGKQPMYIPLAPVEKQGDADGRAADAAGGSAAGEIASPDRDRRQGR